MGNKNVQLVLPNELNDDVGRFTTHHQTCLVTNQVVVRCEKLLWKVESSSTFYNKICTCCAFCSNVANKVARFFVFLLPI